jgi:hypothetical protein
MRALLLAIIAVSWYVGFSGVAASGALVKFSRQESTEC